MFLRRHQDGGRWKFLVHLNERDERMEREREVKKRLAVIEGTPEISMEEVN